jgi:hypothetical protein
MTMIEAVKRSEENMAKCHTVADMIQTAVQRWTVIVKMTESIRTQIEVAGEWRELHERVLGELEDELEECADIAFALHETRFLTSQPTAPLEGGELHMGSDEADMYLRVQVFVDEVSKSLLTGTMTRLPAVTSNERIISARLAEVTTRLRPLKASLDFLHVRIDDFSKRAGDWFPSSVGALRKERQSCEERFDEIYRDVEELEKQFCRDQWHRFLDEGVRYAGQLMDNLEYEKIRTGSARSNEKWVSRILVLERLFDVLDGILRKVIVDEGGGHELTVAMHKTRWIHIMNREVAESESGSGAGLLHLRPHAKSESVSSSLTALDSPPTSVEVSPVLDSAWLAGQKLGEGPLSLTPIRGLAPRRSSNLGVNERARTGPRRSLIPIISPAKRPTTSVAAVTVHANVDPGRTSRQSMRRPSSRNERNYGQFNLTPSKIPRPSSSLGHVSPAAKSHMVHAATPRTLNRKVSMPARMGLPVGENSESTPSRSRMSLAPPGRQTPTVTLSPRKSSMVRNAPTPILRPASRQQRLSEVRPPWR